MSNQAAAINAAQAQMVLEEETIPTPGSGEILVKVKAIGFSPLEAKIQKYVCPHPYFAAALTLRRFAMIPIPYPNVLGMSFSGTVESVGPDVTKVKAGDKVAVVRTRFTSGDARFGAFQQYALASETSTSKLPDSVSLEAGASSILNLAAIAACFGLFMGIEKPTLAGKPTSNGKKMFIYGGSSPLGGLAVSYAVGAGYQVVTTSSPKHKDFVQALKPTAVLDHRTSDLAEELASHGPYDAIFDAIGLPPATDLIASYLHSVGGGKYYTTIPPAGSEKPIPDDVQRLTQPFSFALDEASNADFRDWFYDELVPRGLESGVIVPTRAQWLEGGLVKAQEALDMMLEGKVSGKKLLLDPHA